MIMNEGSEESKEAKKVPEITLAFETLHSQQQRLDETIDCLGGSLDDLAKRLDSVSNREKVTKPKPGEEARTPSPLAYENSDMAVRISERINQVCCQNEIVNRLSDFVEELTNKLEL